MAHEHLYDWQPDNVAREFIAQMIASGKHYWAVPCNHTLYRIDHEKKQFVLIEGGVDEIFHMNGRVLVQLGWSVVLPENLQIPAGSGKTSAAALIHDL